MSVNYSEARDKWKHTVVNPSEINLMHILEWKKKPQYNSKCQEVTLALQTLYVMLTCFWGPNGGHRGWRKRRYTCLCLTGQDSGWIFILWIFTSSCNVCKRLNCSFKRKDSVGGYQLESDVNEPLCGKLYKHVLDTCVMHGSLHTSGLFGLHHINENF